MTKDQLNQLIKETVLKEVQRTVPLMVRDVMSKMLMEVAMQNNAPIVERRGNSHKRRAIQEASYGSTEELEDYPTMNQHVMARNVGFGNSDLIVSEAVTDNGTPIPVDPNELPDHLVRALTRNYSDVMDVLNKKNG